ncbi:MAG: fibronectin type III domain-containing protein [Chloroflexota bacterium]
MTIKHILTVCILVIIVSVSGIDAAPASPDDPPSSHTATASEPIISQVQVTPQARSVTITWTTDRPATSAVMYTTDSLATTTPTSSDTLTTKHRVVLTSLTPATSYLYRIISAVDDNHVATTTDHLFTTLDTSGNQVPPTKQLAPPPIFDVEPTDSNGPTISIWYGDAPSFGGTRGQSQRWVNILGRVNDPDGVKSLHYQLNEGETQRLSLGPFARSNECRDRRLYHKGDFNVEIATSALKAGTNTITLIAKDQKEQTSTKELSFTYKKQTAHLPYVVHWANQSSIQDAAHVVDGKWSKNENSIGTDEEFWGYDRSVAIGDMSWTDYEVTVPVTIHGFDPDGFQSPSNGPGVGVIMRWQGHYGPDEGLYGDRWPDCQPRIGFSPFGVLGWYRWRASTGEYSLHFYGNNERVIRENPNINLTFDVTYNFKIRVITDPEEGHLYSMKVWRASNPEPQAWSVGPVAVSDSLDNGSLLLVSHHADATFGTVRVEPFPYRSYLPTIRR